MSTDMPEGQEREGPPGQADEQDPRERTCGLACHLAALAGLIVPFGNILGPLVAWLGTREESAFADDQGRESLNFQINVTLVAVVYIVLVVIGLVVSIALFGDFGTLEVASLAGAVPYFLPVLALALFDGVMVVVASVRTGKGVAYRYPPAIRLLRWPRFAVTEASPAGRAGDDDAKRTGHPVV
jgi:uncharacterized Tic20 family protein